MSKVNKNSTIGEVVNSDERYVPILLGFGLHCLQCPMSQMESLEEACMVHGIDPDLLIKKLNEVGNADENKNRAKAVSKTNIKNVSKKVDKTIK